MQIMGFLNTQSLFQDIFKFFASQRYPFTLQMSRQSSAVSFRTRRLTVIPSYEHFDLNSHK